VSIFSGEFQGIGADFFGRILNTVVFVLRTSISCFMHSHMRTTIDVPDDLLKRVKPFLAERKMTFRALVIDAVERAIEVPAASFRLRDASAGHAGDGTAVSSEAINRAINEGREPAFHG